MARCIPPNPAFATESERQVWELLRTQLGDDALIVANLRVTDRKKDHELDLLVVIGELRDRGPAPSIGKTAAAQRRPRWRA